MDLIIAWASIVGAMGALVAVSLLICNDVEEKARRRRQRNRIRKALEAMRCNSC